MPERPPIRSTGLITKIYEEGRLFEITMENGYTAYAVLERKGPQPAEPVVAGETRAAVQFSPFDMSRCKIAEWEGVN